MGTLRRSLLVLALLPALLGCGGTPEPPPPPEPTGDLVTQTRELKAYIAEHPTDLEAPFALANVLARRGLFEEAIDRYRAVVRSQPDNAAAWHNLGLVYERQGLLRDAREALVTAAEVDPSSELFRKDADRLESITAAGPDNRKAFADKLSRCYKALGQHDAAGLEVAAQLGDDLLAFYPAQAEVWNATGLIAARQGDASLAATRLDRAIELDPALLQPRYNRAILAWTNSDTAVARQQLTALVNLTKGDDRAANYIGKLLEDLEAGKAVGDARVEAQVFEE